MSECHMLISMHYFRLQSTKRPRIAEVSWPKPLFHQGPCPDGYSWKNYYRDESDVKRFACENADGNIKIWSSKTYWRPMKQKLVSETHKINAIHIFSFKKLSISIIFFIATLSRGISSNWSHCRWPWRQWT